MMSKKKGVLCLIVLFLCVAIWGIFNHSDNENTLNGAGTIVNPYKISNEEDLRLLKRMVDAGVSFRGEYIYQTENIELSDRANIFPIATGENGFYGIYNGCGHSLSNVQIQGKCAALFENLGGTIENLTIVSGTIKGNKAATFAINSKGSGARIINCSSAALVVGAEKASGIADSFVDGKIIFANFNGELDSANKFALCGGNAKEIIGVVSQETLFPEDFTGYSYLLHGNDERIANIINSYLSIKSTKMNSNYEVEVSNGKIYVTDKKLPHKKMTALKGSGTLKSPYKISNEEDFHIFADLVNVGVDFYHKYVSQEKDLNMSSYDNFPPVGIFESGHYFFGIYDGCGYAINNLRMIRNDGCGLFAELAGTVINLNLIDCYIEGTCVGAFASHSYSLAHPQIINCYSNTELKGIDGRVGGVADNFIGGDIIQCVVDTSKCDGDFYSVCSYNADYINDAYDLNILRPDGKIVNDSTFKGKIYTTELQSGGIGKNINKKMAGYRGIRNIPLYMFNMWDENQNNPVRLTNRRNTRTPDFIQMLFYAICIMLISITLFMLKKNMRFSVVISENNIRNVYVITLYGFALFFFILNLFMDGFGFDKLFFYALRDSFSDRIFCIQMLSHLGANRYSDSGYFYPPLMAFIYWIPSFFNGGDIERRFGYLGTDIENDSQIVMITTMYFIILMVLFFYIIKNIVDGNKREKILIAFSFFVMAPVIFGIERGNSVISTLLFMLVFVFYYRDNRGWIREVAFLCLAIAINMKIYPIFLVLLLYEVEQKKASIMNIFKVGIYTATIGVISIAPFGGFKAILNFINTVKMIGSGGGASSGAFSEYSINYRNLCGLFFGGKVATEISYMLLIELVIIIGLAFYRNISHYKKLILLCICMCAIPSIASFYVAAVFVIPLIEIINIKKASVEEYIFLILILFMTALMPYYFIDFDIRLQGIISAICMLVMQNVMLIDIIKGKYVVW